MRKIETQMNEAITDRTDWGKDNTRVETIDGVSKVYLYGNLIAEIDDNAIILLLVVLLCLPPSRRMMALSSISAMRCP